MSNTMSDSFILDALAQELQCGICRELLEDPRSPCSWGHSFCKKCLVDVVEQDIRDDRPLLCPLCRASFTPAIIDKPIVVDKGSNERTSRILEKLRLRAVKLPKRDIGIQTEPMPSRSAGQQTDVAIVRDQGQQTNVSIARAVGQHQRRRVRLTLCPVYTVESQATKLGRRPRKEDIFSLEIPLTELPRVFVDVGMLLGLSDEIRGLRHEG
ncbi:hypothetical protein HD806DRAFT_495090 [Xylariaceae sp. AK1471]|nr:hypothetical protein HD806DRAFT_495090 [Xylariaceae sp. AK1471]